jgi:Zn-dependent peptidase ImmA (M78 family)
VRIPRKLTIRGKTWTVKLRKGLQKRAHAVGLCEQHKKLISIDTGISRRDQELTLIHEILHAIWPTNIVGDRTEEKLIGQLEERLYEVLTKNKL